MKTTALFALILTTLSVQAIAQDFNHRDSRERRRGDWRRGFGDGTDCEAMKQRVRQALLWEAERNRHVGDRRMIAMGTWQQVYAMTNSIDVSPATRYLAGQAMNCERQRRDSFDRDVDRESEEWHRRNPDPDPR